MVVGGAGFIGSHMVDYLIGKDCEVLVLDNLSTGNKEWVNEEATFEHCDITHSESELASAFKRFGAQVVYNYAAYPYIPVSFHRPLHVFQINTIGAMNVINAAHTVNVANIIQISSAEVYGESMGKICESDKTVPHSTYGASKLAIDYYVQSAWKERNTPVLAIRQFNCVGTRETHPYVIPEIIRQILSQRIGATTEIFLGNNSQRDFIDVEIAVEAHAELCQWGEFGEVYNLGSSKTIRIFELAKLIFEVVLEVLNRDPVAHSLEITTDSKRVRPWEIWSLRSDNTKIQKRIGAIRETDLKSCIRKLVMDYLENGFIWEKKEKVE